ncbi:MAG: trypsin-like peptidase domain-containing protein [Candidatus Vecturithrix sp.]|jgi:hypothetical protein|nr:trypsin-like peptidase domain-containing protein [Candidatus Vecturithrix sp.]
MNTTQRTHQKRVHLQQEWDLLNEKLSRLEQAKILETRADEIFRLEYAIEEVKKQIVHVEQDLKNLEHASTATENKMKSHENDHQPVQNWRNDRVMNPTVFVIQEEIPGFIKTITDFAVAFQNADDRRAVLSAAGIDARFMAGIKFDTIPVLFANSLAAKFRDYKVSSQRLDYHPLIALCSFWLDAGASHYGLDDQNVALCQKILVRGRENLNALKARESVARIESPQGTGIGTGVLIAENALLTCYHVFNKRNLQQAWVRFGYKEGSYGVEDCFELDMNSLRGQHQPDYAVVNIQGQPRQRIVVPVNKVLSSGQETRIRIIHHPHGLPVQVSETGQIVQVGTDYIAHNLRTDEGSSGAPIFDHHWDLVAIHSGNPGLGREIPTGTKIGVPISAIWERITSYQHH